MVVKRSKNGELANCGFFFVRRCDLRFAPFGPQKIQRAGCAFVPRSDELSASAYGLPDRTRPTRVPCSLQGGSYGLEQGASRPLRAPRPQIAAFSLHNGVFAHRSKRSSGRFRKCPWPGRRRRVGRGEPKIYAAPPRLTRDAGTRTSRKERKKERDGGTDGQARGRHGRRTRDRQGDRGAARGRGRVPLVAGAEPGRARGGRSRDRRRRAFLRHPRPRRRRRGVRGRRLGARSRSTRSSPTAASAARTPTARTIASRRSSRRTSSAATGAFARPSGISRTGRRRGTSS